MNPCPCGYLGDGTDRCRCGEGRVRQYRNRISGPLLDRFDIHIEVPQVPYAELVDKPCETSGEALSALIAAARARQRARGVLNARLDERSVWELAANDRDSRRLLAAAQERWHLSARSIVRVLRVTRTLADLAGVEEPGKAELAEALSLRLLDRPTPG
jgi:magnesium chelatase family protein